MGVYFWALGCVPLIYMTILMPEPQSFDYSSFIISFEIGKAESSNFML